MLPKPTRTRTSRSAVSVTGASAVRGLHVLVTAVFKGQNRTIKACCQMFDPSNPGHAASVTSRRAFSLTTTTRHVTDVDNMSHVTT